MTEYHVRSRPGGTTVRVSRPGGVTRVRTRLLGGTTGGAGGGVTGDSELVATSTTLTGPPHTIAVAAAGSIDITVTLPDATAADKGLVWYIRNLNSDSIVYVANLAEGNETITESKGLLVAGIETDTPGTYVWMKVGFVSETGTAGGGAALSDSTPQALGTAAAGTGTAAARDDHVHAMPTATSIAVDASGFNGNLTTSDDTVQEVAQKLNDLAVGGSETLAATIIDAKGDLIAGTAADTAARLAVGTTNGQVLAVSSGATPGVAWTAPGPPMLIPSTRHSLGGPWASDTAAATAQDAGYMIGTLMYLPPGQSFDRIGILISASGASGATLRLGIYNIGANGYPTTQVVAHTGTLNCGSGGLKEATVSFVGVGWCWGVWQTAGAAVVSRTPAPSPMIAPLYVAESNTINRLIYVARADSALPSDLTAQSWSLSNAYPHGIQVRAA